MAAMDRDTFIPLGTSIVKLLLIASGQGSLATAVGEGAGLLATFRRTLEIGRNRAVFADKIADDAAKQLLREHQGVSEADWRVAARQAASLIDQLSEKERLAAGYNWEELRRTLLDLGGTDLRSDLVDESARQAFDWVLEVACQRIADCFTEKEALASILESVEEVRAGIQRLADRPAGASQTRAVVADHLEVVRDLAPDPLEEREREIAELTAFVHGAPDAWYAMEAGMISGKTALMSSFALNPPSDVHIVSFFIRRMGGDGNDWRSFSFVAGAQLAEILGDEYTEWVSEPASQNTEFRQLLRRAATACQSDKNPRPLILVIDGVDEDSYYERPDDAAAKSILSLLPRRLPEGVKVMTASRPNPRPPEDIVCDSPRRVVSLEASPIAQKKINQKDIDNFLNSKYGVDIGAFLAACGGSLTVDELRQLIARRRRLDAVPSGDIKACVERSPGRILMRVNVGFGDRPVPSYTLGHDAVLRAVLRELSPDLFGGDEGVGDEAWWAESRERVLLPYCHDIRGWVKERAKKGWGKSSSSYMLTEACFNLVFCDEKELGDSIQIIINPGRYKEMLRRSRSRSRVLEIIDREYFDVMSITAGKVSEDDMGCVLEVAELRGSLAKVFSYVPGLYGLKVTHFGVSVEEALDVALVVDDPKGKVAAISEIVETARILGKSWEVQNYIPKIVEATSRYVVLRDRVMRLIIDVLANAGPSSELSGPNGRCDTASNLALLADCLPYLSMKDAVPQLMPLFGGGETLKDMTIYFSNLERSVGCIVNPTDRVLALVSVVDGCVSRGLDAECWKIVERVRFHVGFISDSWLRAEVLASLAAVLARGGLTSQARDIAASAKRLAVQVGDPWRRAGTLVKVAGALFDGGLVAEGQQIMDRALKCARRIDALWLRAEVLASAAVVLARGGRISQARHLAVSIKRITVSAEWFAVQVGDPWRRAGTLVKVAGALFDGGLVAEGQQIMDRALKCARRIDALWLRAEVLASAAVVLARGGRISQAREIVVSTEQTVGQANSLWLNSEVLAKIADVLIDGGVIERGRQVAVRVDDPEVRAGMFVRVAGVLAGRGFVKQAEGIVSQALGEVGQICDPQVRMKVLVEMVSALIGGGFVKQGYQNALLIDDPWLRGDALVELSSVLAGAGMIEQARHVVAEISHPWWRARALSEVTVALAGAGMIEQARHVVAEISHPWWRARALSEVTVALAGAGMIKQARSAADEAVRAVKQINDRQLQAEAVVKVAEAFAGAGMAEQARYVADLVGDCQLRAEVLAGVVVALVGGGMDEQARSAADEAVGAVKQIDDRQLQAEAVVKVAEAFAGAGMAELGRDVVDEAAGTVERINDCQLRAKLTPRVAKLLASVGQVERAGALIPSVVVYKSRLDVQRTMIKALIKIARSDDAVDIVRGEISVIDVFASRSEAAGQCGCIAELCIDAVKVDDKRRERWADMGRAALTRSWFYGASVWDHFDILMRVAPELAVQLVDERILADPEQGTAPESDLGLGPEGPGGDAGSYR